VLCLAHLLLADSARTFLQLADGARALLNDNLAAVHIEVERGVLRSRRSVGMSELVVVSDTGSGRASGGAHPLPHATAVQRDPPPRRPPRGLQGPSRAEWVGPTSGFDTIQELDYGRR
jgi:hypothetical protein